VVYGWYNRVRYWPSARGWDLMWVVVDGDRRETLDQLKRGPAWIGLEPGEHSIEFRSGRTVHRSERVSLGEGEAWLLAFKPQERVPFAREPTREQWDIRRLWP